MSDSNPFQSLPPLAVGLAGLVLAIEAVFQLGAVGLAGGAAGVGWRMSAIVGFGFHDPLFESARAAGRLDLDMARRLVSYGLIHAGAVHALFAAVLVLALGKAVSERFTQGAMAGLVLAGLAAGALAYGLFQNSPAPLIGLYPGIYGLIGGFTWSLFTEGTGRARLAAFKLIGVLLTLQLVVRLVIGGGNEWIADLAGFAVGFGLSWVIGPGARARIRGWRDRVRQR